MINTKPLFFHLMGSPYQIAKYLRFVCPFRSKRNLGRILPIGIILLLLAMPAQAEDWICYDPKTGQVMATWIDIEPGRANFDQYNYYCMLGTKRQIKKVKGNEDKYTVVGRRVYRREDGGR